MSSSYSFCYETAISKNGRLKKKLEPTKGVINNNNYFYKILKNGNLNQISSWDTCQLSFTRTEKEAIEEYNKKVKQHEEKILEILEKVKRNYIV